MRNLDEINRLLKEKEEELAGLNARKAELLVQITNLQRERSLLDGQGSLLQSATVPPVTNQSAQDAKIALFRSLFRGREDVYPKLFESMKTGKSGYQPACRNPWVEKSGDRELLPLTDDVVRNHLMGVNPEDRSRRDFTIGTYPMLFDETCWFLAADFDKVTWPEDAIAFLDTCKSFDVPAVLERSRSGNGGHVWVFFSEPTPAVMARKMGAFLLTQTMEQRPEIGLDSYDRFFPSQDTLPRGGFGNLIALPLQKKPRANGNSLFVDVNLVTYQDQWAFLSTIHRMSRRQVEGVVDAAEKQGEFLGIRIPITDENDDQPWAAPSSRQHKDPPILGPVPEEIDLVLSNQIYVPKADLTP